MSGTFGTDPRNDMADWLANRSFDVQVARLELCCPCCRIFETSTSKKFRAGGVHAVAFRDIDVKQLLGLPSLLISVSLSFWPQGVPQVPHDDVTSSRAQVNCLKNKKWNTVDAVREVLHLNVDEWEGLQGRASYCLPRILSSLAGGNKVGVTLSHTGATRAASLKGERGRGKVGGWWVDGGVPQCPCNRFLVGMEGGRAGREGRVVGQLLPHILPDTT